MKISATPWSTSFNGATAKVVDADDKAVCTITGRIGVYNGDLLAAAPNLLEALHEAYLAFAHNGGEPVWSEVTIAKTRFALMKAGVSVPDHIGESK